MSTSNILKPDYFYLILSGIKVIELAGVLAGLAVGLFLAEPGADVIKVENPPTGGGMMRKN